MRYKKEEAEGLIVRLLSRTAPSKIEEWDCPQKKYVCVLDLGFAYFSTSQAKSVSIRSKQTKYIIILLNHIIKRDGFNSGILKQNLNTTSLKVTQSNKYYVEGEVKVKEGGGSTFRFDCKRPQIMTLTNRT